MPTPTSYKRTRRSPEVAEALILDTAEVLLRERPFRDLSVDELMSRAGMRRSSFYTYFKDRSELVVRLIARIGGEMLAVADRWLAGPSENEVEDVREALREVIRIYAEHGPVLAAIAEAAHHDDEVERVFGGQLENFRAAVATRIRSEKRAGRSTVTNPEQAARALVLMTERFLAQRLGREPQDRPLGVAKVLEQIWIRTIYGAEPKLAVEP